jgi:hypothetical protein
VFEGRDGASNGGVIKAITARVSPRIYRIVALPAPTEREKSQMYIQRYSRRCISGDICATCPPRAKSSSSIAAGTGGKTHGYVEPDYPYKFVPELNW